MRGNVDLVTPEGLVEGWCWNEEAPEQRVTVAIHVDGVESGRAVACHFRKDLHDAGIGDGGHFFRLLLPEAVLRQRRNQKIVLIDPATGRTIGDPYTVQFEYGLRFDDRLSELEARNRLLESRLNELADVSTQRNASAELFAVVGAFFKRLSEDVSNGVISTPERQLSEAIQAATKALPPVVFPAAIEPAVTVLVEANCPLSQLHRCLAALRHAAAGISLRVVILDNGSHDDAALICTVAQGVQYLRVSGDIVSEIRNAGAGDTGALLVLLSGYAVVAPSFLAEVRQSVERHAHVGAVTGCSPDETGHLRPAAIRVTDGGLIAGQDFEGAQALEHGAVVFRRRAIEAIGGLDPIFGDELWAAVIDLCFRLRAKGWSLACLLSASFSLVSGKGAPSLKSSLSTPSRAGDLLLHRWVLHPEADVATFVGHVAVVGEPDRTEEEMDAVRRMRTAGFNVHYLAPEGADTAKVAALQRIGAQVALSAESFSSIPTQLIFAASDERGLERLNQEARAGAQLVIGLPRLVSVMESSKTASLAMND